LVLRTALLFIRSAVRLVYAELPEPVAVCSPKLGCIGDDALRRRTPAVVDFDGAWPGGNAGVRVMNPAVKREN
jgi:hypothetical protein